MALSIYLDAEQKTVVKRLLMNYDRLLSLAPGCTTAYQHPIVPTRDKVVVVTRFVSRNLSL